MGATPLISTRCFMAAASRMRRTLFERQDQGARCVAGGGAYIILLFICVHVELWNALQCGVFVYLFQDKEPESRLV